jgi:hypothetical protein
MPIAFCHSRENYPDLSDGVAQFPHGATAAETTIAEVGAQR